MLALLSLTTTTVAITVFPVGWISSFVGVMELDGKTQDFRYTLLLFPIVNLIVSLTIEVCVIFFQNAALLLRSSFLGFLGFSISWRSTERKIWHFLWTKEGKVQIPGDSASS